MQKRTARVRRVRVEQKHGGGRQSEFGVGDKQGEIAIRQTGNVGAVGRNGCVVVAADGGGSGSGVDIAIASIVRKHGEERHAIVLNQTARVLNVLRSVSTGCR